jgi:hypothetical protein
MVSIESWPSQPAIRDTRYREVTVRGREKRREEGMKGGKGRVRQRRRFKERRVKILIEEVLYLRYTVILLICTWCE